MPLHGGSNLKEMSEFRLRRVGSPASFPGIGDVFSLNKGVNVIGRNPSKSDIFLDSMRHKALISRLHARIVNHTENGKTHVEICDTSLNGTFVNDKKIADTMELKSGDVVTFGHLKGAVLEPGTVTKQPNSEFRFKLEKFPSKSCSKDDKENAEISTCLTENVQGSSASPVYKPMLQVLIPDLSPLLRPCTTASQSSDKQSSGTTCTQASRQLSNSNLSSLQQSSSQSSEYCDSELFAYAAAAEGAMDGESDDELFSVDLPSTSNAMHGESTYGLGTTVERLDLRTEQCSARPSSAMSKESFSSFSEEEITENNRVKRSKRTRRKSFPGYLKNKKSKKTTDLKEKETPETCASRNCAHPTDEFVDWVMCDYCGKWYHLDCVGISLMDINSEDIFNCGCKQS